MKKMMRVLSVFLMIVLFSMMVLGSGSETDTGKSETKALSGSEEKTPVDTAEKKTEAETEKKAETEAPTPAVTIEEQLLFEADGVTVTAKEYTVDKMWGDGIKLLIENNGSADIGISCDALIVNDYMISDLFSETVAAGKKSNSTLNLSTASLKAAGIETVGKIEVYFHTFDAASYMTMTKLDCVTINTSAADTVKTEKADDGKELYNADGIRIVGKYVDEDSFWGAGILLFIENGSGKNIGVQASDLSVNGFMLTPIFSCAVYDGKMALSEITLLNSELEENEIESIEEVELKFHIFNEDNYETIKDTEPITFTTK